MTFVFPQEIEVWYILPALRKELAIAMKKHGLKQNEISKKLGVTAPAVSQYLRNKRANIIFFNKKIKKEIFNSATRIINEQCLFLEIRRLCEIIRKEKVLCAIHKKYCNIKGRCYACV
ncbi:MAG: helix-turn-helix domain-containing protein [Candidatus Woesearchaeota archaeon]